MNQMMNQTGDSYNNGGTTIVMTNPNPAPTYGMQQPMYQQPMGYQQPMYAPTQPQPIIIQT